MFFYFGIIAFIAIQGSNTQEQCLSPSKALGKCINIYDCSPFLKLLRKSRNLRSKTIATLRNYQCGYEGSTLKVCCAGNMQGFALNTMNSSLALIPPVVSRPQEVTHHRNRKLFDNKECGSITEPKILYGSGTKHSEFPWMALLVYNINGQRTEFRCGGSLINRRYVLTAAHCVSGLPHGIALAGVRLGEHDLRTDPDCYNETESTSICTANYQTFFPEKIHVHRGYERKTHTDDIALIRMDRDADLKPSNVKPICLPIGERAELHAKKVIVTGWGKTEAGKGSKVLQKVTLDLISHDECTQFYMEKRISISSKQLCAGGKNRKDSCSGDSGGPLQYSHSINGQPRYFQYGLVSFGSQNCGVVGYPGVYTSVAHYMEWILDTIAE